MPKPPHPAHRPESTEADAGARRLELLRRLALEAEGAATLDAAFHAAANVLAGAPADVAFGAIYTADEAGACALLRASFGPPPEGAPLPASVSLAEPDAGPWPLAATWRERRPRPVEALAALVLPIGRASQEPPAGLLVAAPPAGHAPDAAYHAFLELVGAQLAGLVADAQAQRRLSQLRSSEERFRLAADAVNGIIYEYDVQTGRAERSRGLYEVTGFRPEEAPPTAAWWLDRIHPDDRARIDEHANLPRVPGERVVQEYRFRHADGRWLHLEDRSLFMRDAEGRPWRLVGCTVDVTARKEVERQRERSESALRDNVERFSQLVEQAPFGIYVVDSDFRLCQVNAGAQPAFAGIRPLLGRSLDEVLRQLWPEPFASEALGHFRHTLETGESYVAPSLTNERLDTGVVESYEWEIHRVTLADGRYGVVCYFYDATELRRAQQALEEADRRKDEFLATLAHELRGPLAPLRNGLELMKAQAADVEALARARAMMERQLAHMVRLVDDLLDVSRINSGKLELRREPLDLATVITQSLEASRAIVEQAGHRLSVRMAPRPVVVDGDLTRLAQVFSNLLSNASKFTNPGGELQIAVELDGPDVVVRVRDDGIGIPADVLPRVFDMFVQSGPSLDRSRGGLGIGLSLVRRLVEMHGGAVVARSDGPGKGSEFSVRLPLAPESTAPRASDSAQPPCPRRRILVVDDNADSATSLAILLANRGHETLTAFDGEEALDAARGFRPDVVLLDIGLPGLDGYETARRLRAEPWGEDVLLVALTGWGQAEDRRRSRDSGFDHHLVKPVEPAALLELLRDPNAPGL